MHPFKYHNQQVLTNLVKIKACTNRKLQFQKNCKGFYLQAFIPILNRNIKVKMAKTYILSDLWDMLHSIKPV